MSGCSSHVAFSTGRIGTGLPRAYQRVSEWMPPYQRGKNVMIKILNNKSANWLTVILNLIIEYALPRYEYSV